MAGGGTSLHKANDSAGVWRCQQRSAKRVGWADGEQRRMKEKKLLFCKTCGLVMVLTDMLSHSFHPSNQILKNRTTLSFEEFELSVR